MAFEIWTSSTIYWIQSLRDWLAMADKKMKNIGEANPWISRVTISNEIGRVETLLVESLGPIKVSEKKVANLSPHSLKNKGVNYTNIKSSWEILFESWMRVPSLPQAPTIKFDLELIQATCQNLCFLSPTHLIIMEDP